MCLLLIPSGHKENNTGWTFEIGKASLDDQAKRHERGSDPWLLQFLKILHSNCYNHVFLQIGVRIKIAWVYVSFYFLPFISHVFRNRLPKNVLLAEWFHRWVENIWVSLTRNDGDNWSGYLLQRLSVCPKIRSNRICRFPSFWPFYSSANLQPSSGARRCHRDITAMV